MTWEYRIVPKHSSFPEEALDAWHRFLRAQPSRRTKQGLYQIFGSRAERDEFEDEVVPTIGEHTDYADYVEVGKNRVTIDMTRGAFDRLGLLRFLEAFLTKWPIIILGTAEEELSPAEFCSQITHGPASS
jgi:hypothetical protein